MLQGCFSVREFKFSLQFRKETHVGLQARMQGQIDTPLETVYIGCPELSYKWYGMDAQDVLIVKIPILRLVPSEILRW